MYFLLSFNVPAVVAEEQTATGMIDVFKSKIVVITPAKARFDAGSLCLASKALVTKELNESKTHMTSFSSFCDSSNAASLTSFNLYGSLSDREIIQ